MNSDTKRKHVLVIGAGLGGLSAAISLAQEGYSVSVHEKNSRIGGKLNLLRAEGFSFDLGPSILTLPHILERLFERSGRKMADYMSIRPVRPHWRNFFEDGKVVDLYPEPQRMAEEARKVGEPPENVERFLKYSSDLYDLIASGYFQHGLENAKDFGRFYGPWKFLKFDLLRTMHGGAARFLRTRHMRDIFDYFIKYVGSSAYRAPAFMNCLPTIQFRYDLWYVDGGMYNIAEGLKKLMGELGIEIHCNSEAAKLESANSKITGLTTSDGKFHPADIIVSNMEVIPAYRDLLKEDEAFMKPLEKKLEPACSGLVVELGMNIQYPQLAHHNFFFSKDQRRHFDSVFTRHELPDDPTIYLVAASKTDPTVAPAGCECIKILPHIPYIDTKKPLTREDYSAFKEKVYDKLQRMGMHDLRQHIVYEHVWTPMDIEQQYRSNKGSIYGVATDRFRNLAFKAPKQSSKYANLFFTGGSVNPGGGIPMVVLCGQNVCKAIVQWDRN